ncbi:MAG: hypothetical protein AB1414_19830 [bacterium]
MKAKIELRFIAITIPYIAILIGLYMMNNVWSAVILYHFGIVIFLSADREKKLYRSLYSG